MAIEEKLKSMILNQYKSLRSFCEVIRNIVILPIAIPMYWALRNKI